MELSNLEKLLRKDITKTYKILDRDFNYDEEDKSICFFNNDTFKYYYNMPSYFIHISSDDNGIINSITLYFNGLIDKNFYSSFNKDYGKPSSIQVIDTIETISQEKKVVGDFTQDLKKNFIQTREGSFNEQPLYIIWEKDSYNIRATFRHEQNISEITFSVK